MLKIVARALVCTALGVAALHAQAPDERTQAGWQALQAGNADRAASLFYEAVTYHPREPYAHFGAGVAAHVLGREEDAMRSLARALELNPRLTEASLLLGDIQYHLGDVDGAVRTYEKIDWTGFDKGSLCEFLSHEHVFDNEAGSFCGTKGEL